MGKSFAQFSLITSESFPFASLLFSLSFSWLANLFLYPPLAFHFYYFSMDNFSFLGVCWDKNLLLIVFGFRETWRQMHSRRNKKNCSQNEPNLVEKSRKLSNEKMYSSIFSITIYTSICTWNFWLFTKPFCSQSFWARKLYFSKNKHRLQINIINWKHLRISALM